MRKKVTLQEIADTAGVSKFAVSRALAGKSGVSEETRATIVNLAGQMGYFRSEGRAGRIELKDELTGGWQGTVMILFPNIRHQNRESRYWGPIFEGISQRLNQKGLDVLTLTEPTSEDMFTLLNPEAIRGIITVGTVSTSILLSISRMDIPLVLVDHLDPTVRADTIFTDNTSGMGELVRAILARGYRSLQFVGRIQEAPSFYERWLAYRMVLEQQGIVGVHGMFGAHGAIDTSGTPLIQKESLLGLGDTSLEEGLRTLPLDQLPELFVCVNDVTAQLVLGILEERGVAAPAMCGVTGFDHTHMELPLAATVKVDQELLGKRAVDQLLWRILNSASAPERKSIYAELVLRDTYMPPVRST